MSSDAVDKAVNGHAKGLPSIPGLPAPELYTPAAMAAGAVLGSHGFVVAEVRVNRTADHDELILIIPRSTPLLVPRS